MVPNRQKSPSLRALKTPVNVFDKLVFGEPVDLQTRCFHYHLPEDVIAIRFKCCDKYYPCYSCHEESESHAAIQWKKSEWDSKAILCGVCGAELTINEYMNSGNNCPACKSRFNPNCSKHYALYFQM